MLSSLPDALQSISHSLHPLRLHTTFLLALFPTLRVLISLLLLHLSRRFLATPRPEYGRLFEHERVRRVVKCCAASLVCGLVSKESLTCFSLLDPSVRGFRVAWRMLKAEEWPLLLFLLAARLAWLTLQASGAVLLRAAVFFPLLAVVQPTKQEGSAGEEGGAEGERKATRRPKFSDARINSVLAVRVPGIAD